MKTKKGKTTNKYALTFAAREQQRADRNMISPVLVMAPQNPKFHLCRWQNIENEYSFSNSTLDELVQQVIFFKALKQNKKEINSNRNHQ